MKVSNDKIIKKLKEIVIMIFISILLIVITLILIMTQHILDMTAINSLNGVYLGNWFGLRTRMAFLINIVLYLSVGISINLIILQLCSLIKLVRLHSKLEVD